MKLVVNGGVPSAGRVAIAATARAYMTAFRDMVVAMDGIGRQGDRVIFRWTWPGANSGPGGTGRSVRMLGYEAWTMGADGLIVESDGH